ncbi:MAG: hypothetical protein ACR2I2_23200 [Bryobacteraceae bacterium]
MANILLIGFDRVTTDLIGLLIVRENHQFEVSPVDSAYLHLAGADVILASGDDKDCLKLLATVRAHDSSTPFIVVNRLPETARWLEALEAGATDYWAAPFERVQLRWLLDSALMRTHRAAA